MKINKTLIIAEAGVNHDGDLKKALKLVETASKAGADIVKFQTFSSKELATDEAEKASYQKINTKNDENQLQMLTRLELKIDDHFEIINHCKENNIEFLSTAFDIPSQLFLNDLHLKRYKVPSGEITNLPYLREIAKTKRPVIISTGMSELFEIENALEVFFKYDYNKNNLTLLHCTSEYPPKMKDVNLRAMLKMAEIFQLPVGYSDHTLGIEVSLAAVSLGAKIIEKHLTLDRNSEGPDHKASLDPDQFVELVAGIRNIEKALGKDFKEPTSIEKINRTLVRKSIVAASDISKDELFSKYNLTTKRPAKGISPMRWDDIIGKKAKRDFKKNEVIDL